MSMQAELIEENGPASRPADGTRTSVLSGMRPARLRRGGPSPEELAGSVWAPCAAIAWLLALTPAAVDAVRASFAVALFIAILQAALIVVVLMKLAWRRRLHLLLIGIGAAFSALLLAMISFDRSEYRSDVERFETTLGGPAGPSAD